MTIHCCSTSRYQARQTRHEGRIDTQRLLDDSVHVFQFLHSAEGHVTVLFEIGADLGDESAHDVGSCTQVEDAAG
jgi:hypothetical protein